MKEPNAYVFSPETNHFKKLRREVITLLAVFTYFRPGPITGTNSTLLSITLSTMGPIGANAISDLLSQIVHKLSSQDK